MENLVKLHGSNFYMDRLLCLFSMYENFAIENNLKVTNAVMAFEGTESQYYAINENEGTVKLINERSNGEKSVIEVISDENIVNTFMAFSQLYFYYSGNLLK